MLASRAHACARKIESLKCDKHRPDENSDYLRTFTPIQSGVSALERRRLKLLRNACAKNLGKARSRGWIVSLFTRPYPVCFVGVAPKQGNLQTLNFYRTVTFYRTQKPSIFRLFPKFPSVPQFTNFALSQYFQAVPQIPHVPH